MKISVIVPVHNGGEPFSRCLQALAQARPAPAELIVVADGRSDGSWRQAEQYGARLLVNEMPRGPAFARNRGAEVARGDILFFVDADVMVHPNALAEIQAAFEADSELDALIGSYDDAPGEPGFLSQYRNLLHHYVHQTSNDDAMTFWGACGAVRREVFLQMNGFDERYARPSIEDIELGYRLTQAGHKIRLVKTLQVKHLKAWSAVSIVKTDFFSRALPWTDLILRNQTFANDLNLRHANRFSVAAAGVLPGAVLGAFAWPELLLLAGTATVLLLVLNASLYRFLYRKRGFAFTVMTLPWHWLFYFYSGLAFAVGVLRYAADTYWPRSFYADPAAAEQGKANARPATKETSPIT